MEHDKQYRARFFHTVKEMMEAARQWLNPHMKGQVHKRQARYDYSQGPMYFLGQQILRQMEDAGYPSKIVECYRPAEGQTKNYQNGASKVRAFDSAHQYFEAVDICHKSKGWNVERRYWTALAHAVTVVSEKYNVPLRHGHDWNGNGIPVPEDPTETFWDAAHIEIKGWNLHKIKIGNRKPTPQELWARFQEVLPSLARRLEYERRVPKFDD